MCDAPRPWGEYASEKLTNRTTILVVLVIEIEVEGERHRLEGENIVERLLHALHHDDVRDVSRILHGTTQAVVEQIIHAQAEQLQLFKEQIMSDLSAVSAAIDELNSVISEQSSVVDRVDQKVSDLESVQRNGQDTAPIVAQLRSEIDALKSNTEKLSGSVPDVSGATSGTDAGTSPTDTSSDTSSTDTSGTDTSGTDAGTGPAEVPTDTTGGDAGPVDDPTAGVPAPTEPATDANGNLVANPDGSATSDNQVTDTPQP